MIADAVAATAALLVATDSRIITASVGAIPAAHMQRRERISHGCRLASLASGGSAICSHARETWQAALAL